MASRLRCNGLAAAADESNATIELRRTPGKIHVPRNNQQKETNDLEVISDREVWFVIQYLDPESDHRECDTAAAIAGLAVVCIVCIVCVLLHLRGL